MAEPTARGGSEWPLCERFNISHANIIERHTFLRLRSGDAANMAVARRIIGDRVDEIISYFYAHLESFPELQTFLDDEQTLRQLKATQREYLLSLGRESESLDYVENRLRVGVAHDRVGLEPKWFLSAFAVMFDLIAEHLERYAASNRADAVSLLRSVSKSIWLDAALAVDTYHGAATQRLQGAVAELVAAEERLAALSRTDELTGIANRRHLTASLEAEFARSARFGLDFSVLFADVDHFKRVNDRFGHDGGDAVLREVAALIRHSTRPADIVGRYGGEEFLVGLAHGGQGTAQEVAERVRSAVERARTVHNGQEIAVTISIGVSSKTEKTNSLADLISGADAALYRAKSSGRNRVCEAPLVESTTIEPDSERSAPASPGRR